MMNYCSPTLSKRYTYVTTGFCTLSQAVTDYFSYCPINQYKNNLLMCHQEPVILHERFWNLELIKMNIYLIINCY